MSDEDDEVMAWLAFLEEEGILEWVGMQEDGERTFVFRFDIMRIKLPELFEAMMQEMDQELMNLYSMGFVDIEYDENLNAGFKISDAGRQYLRDAGIPIPEEFGDDS